MGHEQRLTSPELVEAFRKDWEVYGLTLAEMAALYGYRNVNSVSRAAQRLGLRKRPGGTKTKLEGGRWVRRGVTQVWVEHQFDDSKAS